MSNGCTSLRNIALLMISIGASASIWQSGRWLERIDMSSERYSTMQSPPDDSQTSMRECDDVRRPAAVGQADIDPVLIRENGLALVALKTATSTGQGFLFSLDDRAYILTNAHIVSGANRIQAVYRLGGLKPSEANVILMDAVNDIAVLSFDPVAASSMPTLVSVARSTLQVCSNQAQGRCAAETAARDRTFLAEDLILGFDGQSLIQTELQGTVDHATLIRDQYISGNYEKIWEIPAVSRDGVSGSSFYRGTRFQGLVTKVSRGFQNKTFAIPAEALQKRVAELRRTSLNMSLGTSLSPSLGTSLSPSPGATQQFARAAGGGDTGNGSDSSSSPAHWVMKDEYCSLVAPCKDRQITDPFYNALQDSSILIDSKLAFVLMQHNWAQGYLFQAATQAERQLLINSRASFSILSSQAPEIQKLLSLRQSKSMNLTWIQAYQKISPSTLKNLYPSAGSFHDGVFENYVIGRASHPTVMSSNLMMDEIVYSTGAGSWLNFAFANQHIQVLISNDLQSASIRRIDQNAGVVTTSREVVNLKAAPDRNATKHILLSTDGRSRILFIYNELELTRLETLIIDDGKQLIRFSLTQPNLGFK